jgi:hypothetical protein
LSWTAGGSPAFLLIDRLQGRIIRGNGTPRGTAIVFLLRLCVRARPPCVTIRAQMTRHDYEERKRRIEAHHRFSSELIDAARQQELRALELVWMTTAEGAFGRSLPPMPSAEAIHPSVV